MSPGSIDAGVLSCVKLFVFSDIKALVNSECLSLFLWGTGKEAPKSKCSVSALHSNSKLRRLLSVSWVWSLRVKPQLIMKYDSKQYLCCKNTTGHGCPVGSHEPPYPSPLDPFFQLILLSPFPHFHEQILPFTSASKQTCPEPSTFLLFPV